MTYYIQAQTFKWTTIASTNNLNKAIKMMRDYDRDGEVYMRIIDNIGVVFNNHGTIIDRIVGDQNEREEVNWKKEGF